MEPGQLTCLLFVYGSLKRGYTLHSELQQQQFVADAYTSPDYRLYDIGQYPGMVKVASEGLSVKGELYRVSQDCLQRLDEVEGVEEGLYARTAIPLASPFHHEHAWTYLYLQPTQHLRDCGSEWP
jgi:gamma-glutamylaminecyclotransferase